MPVPKRKTSRQRRDKRSANKGIVYKNPGMCPTCTASCPSHQACFQCGHYKGKKVIRTKTDRLHDRGRALQKKRAAHEALSRRQEAATEDKPQED